MGGWSCVRALRPRAVRDRRAARRARTTGCGRGRPASCCSPLARCGWQAAAARVVVARERKRRIEGGCPVGGIAFVAGAVTQAERDVVARRHFFPFDRGYAGVTEVVPLQAAFLPIRSRLRRRKGSCGPWRAGFFPQEVLTGLEWEEMRAFSPDPSLDEPLPSPAPPPLPNLVEVLSAGGVRVVLHHRARPRARRPAQDVGAMLVRPPREHLPLTGAVAGEIGAYGSDEHHGFVRDGLVSGLRAT